ncbi:hypothetical protein [Chitinophaga sp. HK235]|uniref:hypothetical protein n=1 Tax=Chitinophaga sp. HK235 TaxID=2952571 RepID=UPI001BA7FC4E|nr:hypothetical protein [Chitinophaga sp. HK235]
MPTKKADQWSAPDNYVKAVCLFIFWIVQGTFLHGHLRFTLIFVLIKIVATSQCECHDTKQAHVIEEAGAGNPVTGDVILVFYSVMFHIQIISGANLINILDLSIR